MPAEPADKTPALAIRQYSNGSADPDVLTQEDKETLDGISMNRTKSRQYTTPFTPSRFAIEQELSL